MGFFKKVKKGLEKTRESFGNRLGFLFRSRKSEDDFYAELEEILITSDVGLETSLDLVAKFRALCTEEKIFGSDKMEQSFKDFLTTSMETEPLVINQDGLKVFMLLGVNGSGKTTTAAKMAGLFQKDGKKTMLAAADTFRAAAIDQLAVWADRLKIPLIQQKPGADPGAVVFDAISSAKTKKMDVLIADTAGRFHNRTNLVKELQKIDKIVKGKTDDHDQYIKLGVFDATAGSNAFTQAASFHEAVNLDGIIITKMDSSAKGGVAIAIAHSLKLPIYMIGLGESMDDLIPFQVDEFVASLT